MARTDQPVDPTGPAGPAVSQAVDMGPRTLIVGTPVTATQLAVWLAAADPTPRVVGQVLTDPRGGNDAVGPVCGALDTLADHVAATRPDLVLVSLPAAMSAAHAAVVGLLDHTGADWRSIPTLTDQLAGRRPARRRDDATSPPAGRGRIEPATLLDRTPRPLDEAPIRAALTGKTVMITGAGGSIGSELARQVARYQPARLLLVERGENPLFEIDRDLAARHPDTPRLAVMHDVTRADATMELCVKHSPDAVFHAAAHKHVPMMEDHPAEAVENNFYGTRSIADAAVACGAERFVMISTDKAVNPSSVMGATKRLAEQYVAAADQRGPTRCSMVRFGNVLGSACSVLPIWGDQLERGGPITVTDQRMTRYFMTIPEAAGLVLQAGAYAAGGEVFLLDMGEPVRVLDMAERFLRAQGLEPGADVRIALTGARPGEKLFEELAYGSEDMLPTPHDAVRIWRSATDDPEAHADAVRRTCAAFDRLRRAPGRDRPWAGVTPESVVAAIRAAVPEMVQAIAG